MPTAHGAGGRTAKVRVAALRSVDAVDRRREDCLRLTKAVQRTAETMISVADLFDDHVRIRRYGGSHRSSVARIGKADTARDP